jgi:hypothetical protein
MADFRLNLNTIPPSAPVEQPVEENTGGEVTEGNAPIAEPQIEKPQVETPVDSFIENLNKEFGTQYKSRDEVKNIFGLPKKVSEYETKLKESENLTKSIEDYKKKIEELQKEEDPLKYFSSPDTYIAEQLRIKYPKSNPVLLQEIATSNVDSMNDFDVLVKEKQLFVNNPPKESSIVAIIKKKYGIDAETPQEEWDELAKAEMQIDAASARDKINTLKSAIELPKVMTREQRLQAESEAITKKEQVIAPLKESFSKFDKFSYEGFDFDVPSEYQSKLPDMFDAMFIKAGTEPTPENLQSMVELRDALFLHQYFPKIKEVIAKEAETKLQAKIDAELHNTQPPNTATLTDQENVKNYKGLGDFLEDSKRR